MKLRVKDVDLATGEPLIAIVNKNDASKIDLYNGDRIRITKGRKSAVAITNIAESKKSVPPGMIGLFEEVLDRLKVKGNQTVEICIDQKPISVQYIRKKLDGQELSYDELFEIIKDIASNRLSSIELSHFVAACYTKGMSIKEIVYLTKAMVYTGDILKLKAYPVVDLHCIGGVAGNRTTMIIVPIIAAAGITIPKTSSRAITSPAGTADTMEVLADVTLTAEQLKRVVSKTKGCIAWGGAMNLAPADEKIIKVEHPLSIDAEGQMLASVMAKKFSVSSTHLLIDIPTGKGSKINSRKTANRIKNHFETIGKNLGIKTRVIITDGSQPIGNGIGPALEARDCMDILMNKPDAPQDLRKKSVEMAGIMLEMAGKAKWHQGAKMAEQILSSGRAYKKMLEIIKAQGQNRKNLECLPIGKLRFDCKAKQSGRIKSIDSKAVSKIAKQAGAPKDIGAGIYLHKHVGDKVAKGEALFTIHADNAQKLKYAISCAMKEGNGIEI